MNNADIFRSFLVSIGYSVDAKSEKRLRDGLKQVSEQAVKVGKAMVEVAAVVTGAAASIAYAVEKVAESFDRAYYASQRTNSSIGGMKALGYAASQMGGSAEEASSSLENLARFMRENPNAEGILHSWGIQTRDINGQLFKMDRLFLNVQRGLHNTNQYQAPGRAAKVGLAENTRLADPDQLQGFFDQYEASAKKLGLSLDESGASGNRFMVAWRKIQAEFKLIAEKFGSTVLEKVAGYLDRFYNFLDAHAEQIGAFADRVGKDFGQLGDLLIKFGGEAIKVAKDIGGGWSHLGPTMKTIIEILGVGVVGALVAVAAAAFPITATVAAIAAISAGILALVNDFDTWKAGSHSFVNWGEWKPQIDAIISGAKQIGDLIERWGVKLNILGEGGWASSIGNFFSALAHDALDFAIIIEDIINRNWSDLDKRVAQIAGLAKREVAPQPHPGAQSGEKRGIRDNNPGNIWYGKFAKSEGATGSDGPFAVFASADKGLKALADLLQRWATQGRDTINKIMAKYSTTDVPAYIKNLSAALNVSPDAQLNLSDPQTLSTLMNAIVQQENGRNPYASQIATIAGAPVAVQQTVTMTFNTPSPQATAAEVGKVMTGCNRQLRTLKPVAQ